MADLCFVWREGGAQREPLAGVVTVGGGHGELRHVHLPQT